MPHKKSPGKLKKNSSREQVPLEADGRETNARHTERQMKMSQQSETWLSGSAAIFCSSYEVSAHLPCPTFMMTFMARLLHTPPSRFSRPSTVPLEVAGVGRQVQEVRRPGKVGREEEREEVRQGKGKKSRRKRRREDDILVNGHVHNTQN